MYRKSLGVQEAVCNVLIQRENTKSDFLCILHFVALEVSEHGEMKACWDVLVKVLSC
jgi:hypothetical protein